MLVTGIGSSPPFFYLSPPFSRLWVGVVVFWWTVAAWVRLAGGVIDGEQCCRRRPHGRRPAAAHVWGWVCWLCLWLVRLFVISGWMSGLSVFWCRSGVIVVFLWFWCVAKLGFFFGLMDWMRVCSVSFRCCTNVCSFFDNPFFFAWVWVRLGMISWIWQDLMLWLFPFFAVCVCVCLVLIFLWIVSYDSSSHFRVLSVLSF